MKNIYSKLLPILVVLASICVVSCTDDLNQVNNNTVNTENFYANPTQVELAVNGMFHPITNTFFWGRIIHTGAILRSDAFNIRPFAPNTSMSTFQGGPGTARWSDEIYNEPYKAIFRANSIIDRVNEENVPDEAQRNGFLGQAFFIRGFSNFYLVNLFGNVPLVTKPTESSEDFFPDQSNPAAIWSQVKEDFARAAELLPASWDADNIGRPTKGAANAFLGKSQLYTQDWAAAEAAFAKVIDSDLYSLLPAERYNENFGSFNENNEESVFELQFLGISSFAWGVDIPGVGTMGNFHIDYSPPVKSLDQGHYINPWVKEVFEQNNDTVRRNQTIAYDYEGSTGYGGLPFLEDFEADISLAQTEGVEPIFSRKYAGLELGSRNSVDGLGTNVGNNWRVIRYADVLLMQAEAKNELGKEGEAIDLLNEVRERANVEDLEEGVDVRQAIIDERVLELTGEGHRFFDLVRWGLADDYMGANSLHGTNPKSLSGGIFQEGKHELIWIPQGEIEANPKLTQNQGY